MPINYGLTTVTRCDMRVTVNLMLPLAFSKSDTESLCDNGSA